MATAENPDWLLTKESKKHLRNSRSLRGGCNIKYRQWILARDRECHPGGRRRQRAGSLRLLVRCKLKRLQVKGNLRWKIRRHIAKLIQRKMRKLQLRWKLRKLKVKEKLRRFHHNKKRFRAKLNQISKWKRLSRWILRLRFNQKKFQMRQSSSRLHVKSRFRMNQFKRRHSTKNRLYLSQSNIRIHLCQYL